MVVAVGGNALASAGRGSPRRDPGAARAGRGWRPGTARPRARYPGDHPRERPAGGAAGQGERARSRSAPPLPLRCPRGTDPGDDRLLPAAGNGERAGRPGGCQPGVPDPGCRRRPRLRRPRQVRRAGLHGGRGPNTADTLGWTVRPDGQFWRRVVPSPELRSSSSSWPTIRGPWTIGRWSSARGRWHPGLPGRGRAAPRCRGGDRQGPRSRVDGVQARGRCAGVAHRRALRRDRVRDAGHAPDP